MSSLQTADILKELSPMRRYARSLTRDESAADDVVQEALLKALEKRGTFRPDGSRRGGLLAIVHNIFVSNRRREIAEANRNARFAETMINHLAPDQEYAACLREVAQAFAALPEPHRAILHLVAVEGQSYQEAAAILGIPVGTVMSRLSRARAALRRAQGLEAGGQGALRIVGGRDAD
jgi:RNA polymerase sigma-70 factor (ECF subfamily)